MPNMNVKFSSSKLHDIEVEYSKNYVNRTIFKIIIEHNRTIVKLFIYQFL